MGCSVCAILTAAEARSCSGEQSGGPVDLAWDYSAEKENVFEHI